MNTKTKGIIVGTDQKSAWLLPWWWKFYSRHNSRPVTFVDFGMDPESIQWCDTHGSVISCKNPITLSSLQPKLAARMNQFEKQWCGENQFQHFREAIFKKPFAMDMTPYDTTIWIDLDCEICDSIEPLFELINPPIEFALTGYNKVVPYSETMIYNSGVVVFQKGALFLKKWQEMCIEKNPVYATDDTLLTGLIQSEKLNGKFLHPQWNWLMHFGVNPFAKIRHWATFLGKEFIKNHDSFQDFRP